jgi:hypothetical protein
VTARVAGRAAEAMGLGDVFSSIGNALKAVTDRVRNAGSDVVLRFARKPLSAYAAKGRADIRSRDRERLLLHNHHGKGWSCHPHRFARSYQRWV